MQSIPFYRYQYAYTWYKYYQIYSSISNGKTHITFPNVGNPLGLYHEGNVISTQTIRYHYYATEIQSLLRDRTHPVICEIGGGLGGLAHATLSRSNSRVTYLVLDIPEMLVMSS